MQDNSNIVTYHNSNIASFENILPSLVNYLDKESLRALRYTCKNGRKYGTTEGLIINFKKLLSPLIASIPDKNKYVEHICLNDRVKFILERNLLNLGSNLDENLQIFENISKLGALIIYSSMDTSNKNKLLASLRKSELKISSSAKLFWEALKNLDLVADPKDNSLIRLANDKVLINYTYDKTQEISTLYKTSLKLTNTKAKITDKKLSKEDLFSELNTFLIRSQTWDSGKNVFEADLVYKKRKHKEWKEKIAEENQKKQDQIIKKLNQLFPQLSLDNKSQKISYKVLGNEIEATISFDKKNIEKLVFSLPDVSFKNIKTYVKKTIEWCEAVSEKLTYEQYSYLKKMSQIDCFYNNPELPIYWQMPKCKGSLPIPDYTTLDNENIFFVRLSRSQQTSTKCPVLVANFMKSSKELDAFLLSEWDNENSIASNPQDCVNKFFQLRKKRDEIAFTKWRRAQELIVFGLSRQKDKS